MNKQLKTLTNKIHNRKISKNDNQNRTQHVNVIFIHKKIYTFVINTIYSYKPHPFHYIHFYSLTNIIMIIKNARTEYNILYYLC